MDIAADMLEVARGGCNKTAIMFRVSMSFPQLQEYLELLLDSGLIGYSGEEEKYQTTQKGKQFIERYRRLRMMLFPKGRPHANRPVAAARARS